MRRQRGFTMIELIVYLGIASIALLVFFGFASNVMQSAARAKTASDVQENARVIMSRITHDIRTTDTATVSGSKLELTKATGGIPTKTCYGLDLLNPDVALYGTCGTVGCVCTASTAISDKTVKVTTLSFSQAAPQIIVNISVEPRVAGTADPVTLSTTVVPRSEIFK
ncbi:MAG: type II secretion system protein [Candidatus Kerfeldbacteria bacterium]